MDWQQFPLIPKMSLTFVLMPGMCWGQSLMLKLHPTAKLQRFLVTTCQEEFEIYHFGAVDCGTDRNWCQSEQEELSFKCINCF